MARIAHEDLETLRVQIYRWAFRLLRNHHDALDVTQNVLLKLIQANPPSPDSRFAWLRTVTTNTCIDVLRRNRSHREHADRSAPAGGLASTGDQEVEQSITDALGVLTDIQRAVLLAKTYDSETFQQIAAALDISASTVKTHYMRALRKVRDALGISLEKHHDRS